MKKYLAYVFGIALLIAFFKCGGYEILGEATKIIYQSFEETGVSVGTLESELVSNFDHDGDFANVIGCVQNVAGLKEFYKDQNLYITDTGYVMSPYAETTTDYEYNELVSFKEFCDDNGINLLYVNEPIKYLDDGEFESEFAVETYSNRNADLLLSRIREAGINCIDLRDDIREENLNVLDMFYRTDHHWTTPTGLWATGKIASAMNEYCDYNIDLSIYDESNYEYKVWKNCWLGEQGRKIGKTRTGLEDYTAVIPKFDTDFTLEKYGETINSDFSGFIYDALWNTENDVYENESWHYSYLQLDAVNHNVDNGKVLMMADSYAQVTEPFLALGVKEINWFDQRDHEDGFDLRQYIIDNEYDTVIICYAQLVIGAHDDRKSSNYRMFSLD